MGKLLVNDADEDNVTDPRVDAMSDIPSDIIFPDQLNRYLRDQLHSLTLENGGLRRCLEEIQNELTATKEKLAKAQSAPIGRVAETADYKIAQLSKRLREQTAEMESLRTIAKEAEAKLKRFEDVEMERPPSPVSSSELTEKDQQIKLLTDKLQAAQAKMCDFRNQCQAAKQEMKLAQKVIENEIGEKCSIQELAKENGNWRGRAQQILALQNKVQALQEQLNNTNTDNPASNVLRQIEKDRRANYEETSKQLCQKTIQMEEVKKKLDAAKARSKVLENEILQYKTKITALTEKAARDEQLISTLTSQINAFEDRGKAQMQCFFKMQESTNKAQQELELERTKGEQLQKALADREKRIHRMEEQVEKLREDLRNRNYMDEIMDTEKMNVTAEKSTDTSGSQERLKAMNVADTERARLLELLALINKRLDETRKDQSEAESQLRKERYKNAKLETKIARLELEKVGAMKNGRGSYSMGNAKIGDGPNADEDLMTRQHIEYLEEECLALKTRIETLQMEKEADFKLLASMGDSKVFCDQGMGSPGKLHNRTTSRSASDNMISKMNKKSKALSKNSHRVPALVLRQSTMSSDDLKYYDKSDRISHSDK